jgi:hypothetical protein
MFPFNDDITKRDVYGEWTPVQYEQDGVTTEPTVEQRNDFIRFNEDKSFVCQERTELVRGDWYFNGMDNSINIMSEEDPDNCIPLTVQSVNETEMVYRMPTDDGGRMTVWLVK